MKRKDSFDSIQNLALLSHIGFSMVVPIFGGIWFGNFLDKKIGTDYLFLFIGIVIGVMSSFMNLYRIAVSKSKKYKDKDKK